MGQEKTSAWNQQSEILYHLKFFYCEKEDVKHNNFKVQSLTITVT